MSKLKDLHWLYMHNALYIKHKVYIMQCTMIRQMMVGGKLRLSTIISNSCNKDYLRSLHQKENGSRARLGWGTKVTDLGLCKKPTLIDGWSSHHCTRPWYFNIKCQMRKCSGCWADVLGSVQAERPAKDLREGGSSPAKGKSFVVNCHFFVSSQ